MQEQIENALKMEKKSSDVLMARRILGWFPIRFARDANTNATIN